MSTQWVLKARWGCAALLTTCVLLSAQAARAQQGGQPQQERLELTGTAEGIQGNLLYVLGDDGSKWVVQLPNVGQPNRFGRRGPNRGQGGPVTYSGKADPAWLRPGMLVRFSALINKKGEAVEPIRELGVVTLGGDVQLGITSDGPGDVSGFFVEPELKDTKKEDVGSYTVVGELGSIKNGKFAVASSGVVVKGELDENVNIYVSVADIRLMQKGDKVQVNGWYYKGQEGKAQATRLTITGLSPLGVPESKEKRQLLEGAK